jgi:SWI/SNF related-matrix-associated actin-dependent regulator of chromatin subfamily C
MRNYGTYLAELEEARNAHKREERALRQRHAISVDALWSMHREQARSWVTVAMNAPLVMIGLGMGREEWPLWWFLNQRARNHAMREDAPPVFVFMRRVESESLRVACSLANLQLLEFESFAAGWEKLLEAFEAPPVDRAPSTRKKATSKPVTNRPVTNRPVTDRPVTDRPVANRPVTNRPVTNRPVTNRSVTNRSVTNRKVQR